MDSLHDTIFQEPLYLVKEKIAVVLSVPWQQTNADDRLLLQKILGAVGLKPEAIAVYHQATFSLSDLPVKASRILYFGKAEKGLAQNEVITVEGVSIILTSPLAELHQDAAAKQKLWQALKQLFKA